MFTPYPRQPLTSPTPTSPHPRPANHFLFIQALTIFSPIIYAPVVSASRCCAARAVPFWDTFPEAPTLVGPTGCGVFPTLSLLGALSSHWVHTGVHTEARAARTPPCAHHKSVFANMAQSTVPIHLTGCPPRESIHPSIHQPIACMRALPPPAHHRRMGADRCRRRYGAGRQGQPRVPAPVAGVVCLAERKTGERGRRPAELLGRA